MSKKIEWERAIVEKGFDADGRKIERIVYRGEKNICQACRHYYKQDGYAKEYARCELYPKKRWKAYMRACVKFELGAQKEGVRK